MSSTEPDPALPTPRGHMASSEVDQKFLGRLAKAVELENPLLGSMLFKILGLSLNLSTHLVTARKNRKLDTTKDPKTVELYLHILWLSREGLKMLEQYVLPMAGNMGELKVLAHKLRASFYHIFVLFHNQPPVSTMGAAVSDAQSKMEKGKGIARPDDPTGNGGFLPTPPMEGGPVGPPPGFGPQPPEPPGTFLLPAIDYLPTAHKYFREAVAMADELLWGSHSLRLSVKTEYAAFLYECVHDAEGSRKLAKDTVAEVYDASEPMDDDMFNDACELVTVLGKMMKRGLGSNSTPRSKGQSPAPGVPATTDANAVDTVPSGPPPGMENAI